MKRGLVVRDPEEITDAEWQGRLAALQAELVANSVDVALIYNDVSRGDDIGYLTNLCIYWNEGMLAVPADGEATLLTKLSKRVQPWMRATSTLTDLRSGKSFGSLVGAYVADRRAGVLGIVDADLWSTVLINEVTAAAPGWRIAPLGALVRDRRAIPSAAELALLQAAAAVARDALAEATGDGLSMRERLAAIDRTARHGGFADVLARGDQTGEHTTVEFAGEYRHNWLLAARTFGPGRWLTALQAAQRAALGALRPGGDWGEVKKAAEAELSELPEGSVTELRWISQADFATGGELRPAEVGSPAEGEVVALVIETIGTDGLRSVLTDTVHVTGDGAVPLTVAE